MDHLPTAQKRTSHWKKFVYVDGELVKKGPYKQGEATLALARKNIDVLRVLQDICGLPTKLRSDLPIRGEETDKDGRVYLVYDNVGSTPQNDDSERVTTKIDSDVLVLRRRTFVDRVSDREKSGGLTDDVARAALTHLYFRYLMGVGDSGTHNILIRTDVDAGGRVVAGIDMEERRTAFRDGDDPESDSDAARGMLRLLFKRPSKDQIALYRPYLRDIATLPALTPAQEKDLTRLDFDVSTMERHRRCFARVRARISEEAADACG
jgi:hypothetical protein